MANGDRLPVPDPSVLTTEQLHEALDRVKELMTALIDGQEHICNEKFESVNKQFQLVERQRVEQKEDTKAAVDAAFSAAKEAVREQTTASDRAIAKSEAAMLEQLKQLSATFTTAIGGVTGTQDDLKERVSRIESVKQGGRETLTGLYLVAGIIVAVLLIAGMLAAAGAFGSTP